MEGQQFVKRKGIAIENQYFVLFLLNLKELGITFWKIESKDMPGMRRFGTKEGTAFVGVVDLIGC